MKEDWLIVILGIGLGVLGFLFACWRSSVAIRQARQNGGADHD